MKVGIDSYCYHRFFGEVYPQQVAPKRKMTMEGFIERGRELKVDGLSFESCFIPRTDRAYLAEVRAMLDQYGMDRVYAWGHPDGLAGGRNKKAYREMIRALEYADGIGAKVMRVVGSSLMFRFESHAEQIRRLAVMFREAVRAAEDYGIRLAVENHIDFTSDEILTLLDRVDSPWLGLNFDTGNFLRLLDDPVKGMKKLAPHVLATHVKDLKPNRQASADDWYFFSSVPVGDGLVDNLALARQLKKAGFKGFLAVEIDFLHPDYKDEDAAVARSIKELKRISGCLGE